MSDDEPHEPPTDLDRRIGRRITFFREEAGLTRAELAEQLGTSEDEVEAWETAKVVTYAGDIVNLCGVLGIEPNDLLMPRTGSPLSDDRLMSLRRCGFVPGERRPL